jgi:hypothetical protein
MKNELIETQYEQLVSALKIRFEKNTHRHLGLKWDEVLSKLDTLSKGTPADKQKLWSLFEMERTEGEPDVVAYNAATGEYTFYDCAAESPKGRRSLCYDTAALEARKENKPAHSAMGLAGEMGISVLDETEYRYLQSFGPVDTKTSSWIVTPETIRKLGGAIFGDYRYGTVFIYHNGAESYYAARAFRASLRV